MFSYFSPYTEIELVIPTPRPTSYKMYNFRPNEPLFGGEMPFIGKEQRGTSVRIDERKHFPHSVLESKSTCVPFFITIEDGVPDLFVFDVISTRITFPKYLKSEILPAASLANYEAGRNPYNI